MVKVKICGICHESEIGIMNELMPDYVGFVFVPKNRHFIAPEHASVLRSKLQKGIQSVGVFANSSLKSVAMCVEVANIDMIQLHGNETGEYIAALREYTRRPIMKVYKVAGPIDAEKAMYSTADYVMLDGGNAGDGKIFDWSMIGKLHRKFFLSGGLNPDNVLKALELSSQPYAVNVNSGVELNRTKDYRRVMKFISNVRGFKGQKTVSI
ncbi:MAG: phosphoribosylanthranilate isomerase [Synergistaceae bacterium]|nr:phosphoribosylanthranilate isomerase [Synergistaceae bacterium]